MTTCDYAGNTHGEALLPTVNGTQLFSSRKGGLVGRKQNYNLAPGREHWYVDRLNHY